MCLEEIVLVNRFSIDISPFHDLRRGIVFKPSAHPLRTFKTPIQQIASTIPGQQGVFLLQLIFHLLILDPVPYLAVRTFGQTSFLEVDTSSTTPCLAEVATLSHNDTGGRAIVDVTLSTSPFSSLVVNDLGSVYQCSIMDGDKTL